jgi:hypothetical protein
MNNFQLKNLLLQEIIKKYGARVERQGKITPVDEDENAKR